MSLAVIKKPKIVILTNLPNLRYLYEYFSGKLGTIKKFSPSVLLHISDGFKLFDVGN